MQLTLKLDNVALGVLAGVVAGAALGGVLIAHHPNLIGCPVPCGKSKKSTMKKATPSSGATCPFSGASAPASDAVVATAGDDADRAAERPTFFFEENLTECFTVKMVLNKIMFEGRSAFQRVQVVETEQFGKTLVMDGQTQSAEADEHVYHESLVHPAMLLHPNPKRVFIGGGGEFATAREVLRHKSVERCVMIDIDQLACDMCREHLPEWNNGAYEDARFHVEYEDAKAWLEEHEETFDVIIMDICDPIEAGPGYKLYTEEFYNFLKTRLSDNGVVVTQSGPCAIYNAKEECFTVINRTLRSAFNCVVPYAVDVPSFGCNWGFNMATSSEEGEKRKYEILNMDINTLNEEIATRINGEMKFLDGVAFHGLVGLPKCIRDHCDGEDRIMTIDNPVFMFAG